MNHRLRLSIWLSLAIMAMLLGALVLETIMVWQIHRSGPMMVELALRRGPALIYFWALWASVLAMRRIAAGASFAQAMPGLLRHIGIALALGSLAQTLFVPWIYLLVRQVPGPIMYFDPAVLTMGAIGVLLMLMAGLWRQAGEMARELDEFV